MCCLFRCHKRHLEDVWFTTCAPPCTFVLGGYYVGVLLEGCFLLVSFMAYSSVY